MHVEDESQFEIHANVRKTAAVDELDVRWLAGWLAGVQQPSKLKLWKKQSTREKKTRRH